MAAAPEPVVANSHNSTRPSSGGVRIEALLVAGCLVIYAVTSFTASQTKSNTFDEIAHLSNGVSFWRTGDYRMAPLALLTQRWLTLPIHLSSAKSPSLDQEAWRLSRDWEFASQFFFQNGNNVERMLALGRGMNVLLGVALGCVLYGWSRSLFGWKGGVATLFVYACDPTMLAHGGLATTDIAATLCFAASLWALWRVFHRLSWISVLSSGVLLGCALLAKMSSLLIAPIALIALAIRLASGRPLTIHFVGAAREIRNRFAQSVYLAVAAATHVVLAAAVIWAAFGFRYSVVNESLGAARDEVEISWIGSEGSGEGGALAAVAEVIERHRLLPEGYVIAIQDLAVATQQRPAYLNGRYSAEGFLLYFPYAVLYKTPPEIWLLAAIAATVALSGIRRSAGGKRRGDRRRKSQPESEDSSASPEQVHPSVLYRLTPLIVWWLVYWLFALKSDLNIGHRHILPTYAPLYVGLGFLGRLFATNANGVGRRRSIAVVLLLALLAIESFLTWPNYLAYFNLIAGGSRNGHRHLIDSSLDWGQDLPALADWLRKENPQGPDAKPVYLGYFGTADPAYYDIDAIPLPRDYYQRSQVGQAWGGGLYCVSATTLHVNGVGAAYGEWTRDDEAYYAKLLSLMRRLDQARNSPDAMRRLRVAFGDDVAEWAPREFDQARFGRLMAYLRSREPIERIHHTIFIYRLSDEDAQRAQFGRL